MKKRSIITLVVIFGGLFVGLLVFIGVLVAVFSPGDVGQTEESIGVVEVDGSIMDSEDVLEDIERWSDDDNIKGVVVRINSPGGAVAPSQEMYHAVRDLQQRKPVAVSMSNVAASGGYYIACGSDTIFANAGTITGSIGVITQFFNIERLAERVDLEVNTVKSGEFKDSGSPFKPFEEQDEAVFSEMVFDIHDQFVETVADCRDMDYDEVDELADGRVYTGRQARDNGLVDEIGTFQDTVDYLAEETGLDDPPVVHPPEERLGIIEEFFQIVADTSTSTVEEHSRSRVNYKYVGPQ